LILAKVSWERSFSAVSTDQPHVDPSQEGLGTLLGIFRVKREADLMVDY
jgi:hypothetical protein